MTTTAAKRWRLLKRALLNESTTTTQTDHDHVSVRRFSTFNMIHTQSLSTDSDITWFSYQLPRWNLTFEVCHPEPQREDLLSFNNTGNVCVWPSEEVLTEYCLHHVEEIEELRVCELGGGMTCLAGLALAAHGGRRTRILLTDGNEKSVDNVRRIVERNHLSGVETAVLRWDEDYPDLRARFDLVIAADCLFFDEFRSCLVSTMDRLLTDRGQAWLIAPMRSQTLSKFVHLAGRTFTTQVCYDYNNTVTQLHRDMMCRGGDVYDPDLHYPVLVKLYRKYRL